MYISSDFDYEGKKGIVPGWGRMSEKGVSSDVVREVVVPIMSNEECKKTKYKPHEITDNMMCAGYNQGKIDACQVREIIFISLQNDASCRIMVPYCPRLNSLLVNKIPFISIEIYNLRYTIYVFPDNKLLCNPIVTH